MAYKILPAEFFDRDSTLVARDLLGKILVRKIDGKIVRSRIVETESYEGFLDKASHASRGQTLRNAPMFGPARTIYVYFMYGMHFMLNIVCGKKGHPSAVLIRGIDGCVGPGRLTKKLQIDKTLNGKLLGKASGLWIEEASDTVKLKIKKTPRIGVDYTGPVWSQKLRRFVIV